MSLAIRPIRLHWLPNQPDPHDLCAHAGVQVLQGEHSLIAEASPAFAVSTGALHLLRALKQDHTLESPLAEHLIPHCGHFMVLTPDTRQLTNVGCPTGLNWWIRHQGIQVLLQFGDHTQFIVSQGEWRVAVTEFSSQIMAFYDASALKLPAPDDAEWYAAFLNEWHQRHSDALAAV